jgi:hypothetical protein
MPLPPLGVDTYRRWAADRFAEASRAALQATPFDDWALEAQRSLSGIRALPPPELELPPPPPEPEPVYAPPPALGAAQQSPLDALRAGVGSTLSGIGGRASGALSGARGALLGGVEQAQETVGGWADQAQDQLASLGGEVTGGFAQAQAAPLPTLEAPSTWEPSTPLEQAGALASRIPRGAAAPVQGVAGAMGEAVERGREALPGPLGTALGVVGAVPAAFGQLGEQAALGAGFSPEQAEFQGRLAGVVSPGLGGLEQGGRRLGQLATAGLGGIGAVKGALETEGGLGERVGGALESGLNWAQFGQPVGALADVARAVPYRFGRAATEAADEGVLGIRRGQRFRMPELTPEQQVQRSRDGAAEQRVFDAIARLWRRGPEGEAAADDLRFLAVGKGEAGEQAAREYLTGKGLEDVLPPPPAAALPAVALPEQGTLGVRRGGGPTGRLGGVPAPRPGQRLPADYVYHNTKASALADIEQGGLTAGAFSDRPIDFGGDVWVAVRKSDLPDLQTHDYGGVPAHEPNYVTGYDADGFPIERPIPPARLYLTDKQGRVIRPLGPGADAPTGREALLPPASEAGDGSLLGLARRATSPLMARAAETPGERAFDVGAGTLGGVAGAASAPEDATWQERLGRGVAGASLGALGGANLRQLGRVGRGALGDETLGVAAGGGGRRGLRRPTAGQVTDVLSSAPLTSPTSQGANFLAGGARTLERIALELGELRPIDALLDAGTTGKTLLSPSTWKKAGQAFASGPTPRNPGAAGTTGADSLANAPGLAPAILTSGTRANAALDEVIRTANEAGARRVGARRGLTGQPLEDFVRKAGDYATITGKNSPLAHALTHAKGWMSDPAATPTQKTVGHVANALSGYVNMPERVMAATLRSVLSPVEGGFKLTKGALTRDSDLAREGFSRLLYGGILDWKLAQLAGGDIEGLRVYGPPPRNQQLREEMEREGARWDAFVLGDPKNPTAVIPTRNAGIWGEQASLIGGLYTAAVQADREGRTGPLKVLDISNQLAKQTLSDSYLSDYAEFANKIDDLKGVQAAATTIAAYPSRAVALAAGPVNASDPYVRETNAYEGFGPALSRLVPGGRYLLPAKTDPTTGEPLRRRGTGWSRYWGAESGTQLTEQAQELSRLGLNPHDFRAGEYAGEKQPPAALAKVKQTVGSEAGKAVREVMATPAYKEADDAGKKAQLQQALRDADFEADLRLGDTVKRAPRQQADWEYAAVPRYQGISKDAPAEEVRRYNRDVAAAKRARTEARKKYPNAPDKGQAEWARANPEQNRLAQRGEADATTLRKRREEIDQKYGVER